MRSEKNQIPVRKRSTKRSSTMVTMDHDIVDCEDACVVKLQRRLRDVEEKPRLILEINMPYRDNKLLLFVYKNDIQPRTLILVPY